MSTGDYNACSKGREIIMKKRLVALLLSMVLIALTGCGSAATEKVAPVTEAPVVEEETAAPEEEVVEEVIEETPIEEASLKDIYGDYFDVGVCINPAVVSSPQMYKLVLKQFSSVTCENNMKPEKILKLGKSKEDLTDGGTHLCVDFSDAKKEMDFARDNGLKMRGHTLCWYQQTPDWIFYVDFDKSGELASRELMLARVDNYMHDVFTFIDENYPGLFYAYDIVNEAVEDDIGKMRENLWYQTIGEDYVEQVFALARKHAPDYIKLFYNDYNEYKATKQNAIIEMLRPVAEAGNIDGVGMQAHLYTGEQPDHFVKCAKKYADELGVIIHVTEIDVSTPEGGDGDGVMARYYGALFGALKQAKIDGVPVESVSVWGLSDNLSWKSKDAPLLFDKDLQPKKAFEQVVLAGEK